LVCCFLTLCSLRDDSRLGAADERKEEELAAEVLVLKQRVGELEKRNAQLERQVEEKEAKSQEEKEDEKAVALLAEMNLGGGDSVIRDQLDDLQFQLKATQKRLKAANETIKRQAQRIALLEDGE
jgi:hypothetical protein